MLEQLTNMFEDIKTSFIGIRNHASKVSGKVANFTVNIGTDYRKAQEKDLSYLKSIYENNMKLTKIEEEALTELIASLEKNMSDDKTKQSEAQSNAYTTICNGVRMHNESGIVHVFGMKIQEKVIVKGTYPKRNKRPKTIAKDKFRKGLITQRFRTFKVNDINNIAILGQVINPNEHPIMDEPKYIPEHHEEFEDVKV